jgi:hypothetical protein
MRGGFGADGAAGAGLVLDDHRLPPRFGEALPDDAAEDVGAAAGRERDDQVDRLVGVGLRRCRSGEAHGQARQRGARRTRHALQRREADVIHGVIPRLGCSGGAHQCLPSHTAAGISTSPRMMGRAVRSRAARVTDCGSAGSSPRSTENSPLGCSTDTSLSLPGGHAVGDRTLQHAGRGHGHRAQHAHRGMAVVRDEGARADASAVARRGDEAHLRHHLVLHVAQVHGRSGLQADGFDARLQFGVGVQLVAGFVAGASEVAGAHQHHRHAVVDAGDLHAVELVHHVAGGQQLAAHRTGGFEEVDLDRGGGARHAVDARIAVVAHAAAGRLQNDLAQCAGVEGEDAQRRLAITRRHQTAFDGEGADAGQHVAAVGGGVDARLVDQHLREQELQIDAGFHGLADDGHLAGERVGAAHTVDLARIGRAHDGEQHTVALRGVGGQVGGEEERTARRAAAHEQAGDGGLHGACPIQ